MTYLFNKPEEFTTDALRGRQGWYCGTAHRDQHEG